MILLILAIGFFLWTAIFGGHIRLSNRKPYFDLKLGNPIDAYREFQQARTERNETTRKLNYLHTEFNRRVKNETLSREYYQLYHQRLDEALILLNKGEDLPDYQAQDSTSYDTI